MRCSRASSDLWKLGITSWQEVRSAISSLLAVVAQAAGGEAAATSSSKGIIPAVSIWKLLQTMWKMVPSSITRIQHSHNCCLRLTVCIALPVITTPASFFLWWSLGHLARMLALGWKKSATAELMALLPPRFLVMVLMFRTVVLVQSLRIPTWKMSDPQIFLTTDLQDWKIRWDIEVWTVREGLNDENTCNQHNPSLPQAWTT